MENLSMCRICLATDVRLCSIASHLRDLYERITALTFYTEDRRPLVACYICHARLQNCYRLKTSCLWSDELFTEMMRSGVLSPQVMLSTNTFRVVSVLHLSLGPALQDSTEFHVKEAASEDISDTKLEKLYTKDIVTEPQKEQCALLIEDNNQCLHLTDPHDKIKEEVDDVETDAEYINLEDGKIKVEEIGWEPNKAGPSLQLADNALCPRAMKGVSERINLNDSRVGARVSEKSTIAALKYTEDATTNKKKLEVIENEQTEIITFKETKIVTKEIEVEKPVTTHKILKTSDKVDITCDDITFKEPQIVKKPHQCNVCKKGYLKKRALTRHTLIHTGEKPYQCNVCKKCFTQKFDLNRHIRTHTGEKPYQCNICKKCFSHKHNLKSHIHTHTGEKPYQCNDCKKCFIGQGDLKRHSRTHTSEKPFQCNVCKTCFSDKGNLNKHIRTHTSEKPYQCNVCKTCFNNKGNLKRHIRTHTSEKPY